MYVWKAPDGRTSYPYRTKNEAEANAVYNFYRRTLQPETVAQAWFGLKASNWSIEAVKTR